MSVAIEDQTGDEMKLLNTLILLLPATLGVGSAAYLCHEGKEWGWFLVVSVMMFVVGVAASMPTNKLEKKDE